MILEHLVQWEMALYMGSILGTDLGPCGCVIEEPAKNVSKRGPVIVWRDKGLVLRGQHDPYVANVHCCDGLSGRHGLEYGKGHLLSSRCEGEYVETGKSFLHGLHMTGEMNLLRNS